MHTPTQFLNLHDIVGTDSVETGTTNRAIGYLDTAHPQRVSLRILAETRRIGKVELF